MLIPALYDALAVTYDRADHGTDQGEQLIDFSC